MKYWNVPFTVEDFHEFQKVHGSETVLANPLKLFIFAIYNTLSCQILDIVITLVVDETHHSGKRQNSQSNSSQVHIKQVCLSRVVNSVRLGAHWCYFQSQVAP